MKCPRIYTDADGKSHFGEIELPTVGNLPAYVKPGQITGTASASALSPPHVLKGNAAAIYFREWTPQPKWEWHPAPRRQFVVISEGALDITDGGGTKRRFYAGEFFLADDLTGDGHLSELVGKGAKTIFIPLE